LTTDDDFMIDQILFQIGLGGDWISTVIWFVMFLFMMVFYSKIMVYQMILKLDQSASMLEELTKKSKKTVVSKITKNPSPELKKNIDNFLEFFVIEPVSLDPYGIVKKIEHVVNLSEERFKYFASRVAPNLDKESQANIGMGLSAAISLNQIAKVVRHYVELIRKTKNLQLAMVLQMQVPMIERIARALYNGTEALSSGWPIGDSAGCIVAAKMIGDNKISEPEQDTVMVKKNIRGRQVFIIKAKGPGGRLGKPGKLVERLIRTNKVAKVITVDAAAKLEGEKTGSIAEGIGVAIGGPGVDRNYIEGITTAKQIPLDSIVIKMSQEEAIQPIRAEVLDATDKAMKLVETNIAETKQKGVIIMVGVGNTGGVGNDSKAVKEADDLARRVLKIVKARKQEKKSRFSGWFSSGIGM